jgi:hypothetical protein
VIQTENGPKPLTYAQFKARKKRREVPHPVVTDHDVYLAYRSATLELTEAQKNRASDATIRRLEKARDEAEDALRAVTLVMRLRALPRESRGGEKSYSELRAEHPPTEEDHAELAAAGESNAKAQFHSETFGPALVAACLVEPKVTVEQAAEMAADMNEAEWSGLFNAAILVNQTATPTGGLVFS